MEADWRILNAILSFKNKVEGTKYAGALTIELIKKELRAEGFNISNRDVFIEGVPHELDLLIAKEGRQPVENLLYLSDDVVAVLEVKLIGGFGKEAIQRTKEIFDTTKKVNNNIECFYVTVSERTNYKWRMTKENLGYECFELFSRDVNFEQALKKREIKATGQWIKLVSRLRDASHRN